MSEEFQIPKIDWSGKGIKSFAAIADKFRPDSFHALYQTTEVSFSCEVIPVKDLFQMEMVADKCAAEGRPAIVVIADPVK